MVELWGKQAFHVVETPSALLSLSLCSDVFPRAIISQCSGHCVYSVVRTVGRCIFQLHMAQAEDFEFIGQAFIPMLFSRRS